MSGDPSHLNSVRAAALAGFGDLVRDLGGDAPAILRSCGLAPTVLGDSERQLPYRNVVQAVETAARILGAPDFGLRLCARQDINALGLLALVMQSAPSVREGLMLGARHVRLHNPALGYRTFMDADRGLEHLAVFQRLEPNGDMRQITEICVSYMRRIIELLSGGGLQPAAIHFRHAPLGSEAQYRQHLGQTPRFNAAFDGVSVDALAMRQRSLRHNQFLERFVGGFLAGLPSEREQPAADQVRHALANLAPLKMADLGTVSRILGRHPRTLQRRLHAEGVVFEELRDAARKNWARQLLDQRELSLLHIAHLLGFADQSVLTRACQRWFGATPRQLRRDAAVKPGFQANPGQ